MRPGGGAGRQVGEAAEAARGDGTVCAGAAPSQAQAYRRGGKSDPHTVSPARAQDSRSAPGDQRGLALDGACERSLRSCGLRNEPVSYLLQTSSLSGVTPHSGKFLNDRAHFIGNSACISAV